MALRSRLAGSPAAPLEARVGDVAKALRDGAGQGGQQLTRPRRRPPSREGKVQLAFFVDDWTKRQLETIAFEERAKYQNLLEEALDMLFQSRGKARIAAE